MQVTNDLNDRTIGVQPGSAINSREPITTITISNFQSIINPTNECNNFKNFYQSQKDIELAARIEAKILAPVESNPKVVAPATK